MKHQPAIDLRKLGEGAVIHLVGAGGAGMSAIGIVLIEMGFRIEGSDLKESSYVRSLRELGAAIGLGHRAENLSDECRLVVTSTAIREDNPEVLEAASRGIPVISRAMMLAAIMATRKGIAVAGTHGKTTTSSLVTCMLAECGADPTYLIGGELNETGGNAHYGSGELLVAEADESDGSLLYLRPHAIILTNIDWDHLDYFDSLDHTADVFARFLEKLPSDGIAVVCGDDPRARTVGEAARASGANVWFYGQGPGNDFRFEPGSAGGAFTAYVEGASVQVELRLRGIHNIYNAMAALAVGNLLGYPLEDLSQGLGLCGGVRRRFEEIGRAQGITVVDDYAHHPTEVRAVLAMAGEIAPLRIVTVFQPHRYSRTRMLAREFGESFSGTDLVVVADVYGAGEEPEPGVTGELVADSIIECDPEAAVDYCESRAALARTVVELLEPGDLVITMGAGDITQCAREILALLEEPEG